MSVEPWQERRARIPATLRVLPGPLLLLAGAGVATYSVVRYDLRIVATYTVLAALLAGRLWRGGGRVRLTPAATAILLAAAAVVILQVPAFTYLPSGPARTVRWLLAGSALVAAAAQVVPWRRAPDAALLVAIGGYLTATTLLVHGDPTPRIDVWYILQGSADALAHGGNPYTQVWVGPPGVMQAFTYLPWMAVLLAPGRWLAGDVRWALAVITVAGALLVRAFAARTRTTRTADDDTPGRDTSDADTPDRDTSDADTPDRDTSDADTPDRDTSDADTPDRDTSDGDTPDGKSPGDNARRAAAGLAAMLLLLPGTQTQVEQAWTEPVLLTCLVAAGLALTRGRLLLAGVMLALALAGKQHVALLLPVLAAWPRVGVRRAAAAAGLAGLLMMPFFLADPAAMWHDTVTLLVTFPPLKFADTLFIAALNELHWLPPFWLTGALVLATVGSVSWVVRRRNPDVGELLHWCALVLLVANLLNKQAFYNQYWLVLALLVAGWAVPEPEPPSSR